MQRISAPVIIDMKTYQFGLVSGKEGVHYVEVGRGKSACGKALDIITRTVDVNSVRDICDGCNKVLKTGKYNKRC